ncbi:hypothetical protein X727_07865 [Mesorhizobium sp. L103C119B0]|nr:hypothetical protein X727_07865 [Mesorhizobium sp. L103C119B0]
MDTPASISVCAPMMARGKPAQETITRVSGDGPRSAKRSTSSAPGTLMAPGTWSLSNSATVRAVEDDHVGALALECH